MKRLLALGLAAICLACALPLTACTPQQKLYSASWFDMFDTVTMVQGYAASQEEWDTQADALHDDLEHYHQLFDIYHHYDGMVNLYDVNARAGQEPVQVRQQERLQVEQLPEQQEAPAAQALVHPLPSFMQRTRQKPRWATMPESMQNPWRSTQRKRQSMQPGPTKM